MSTTDDFEQKFSAIVEPKHAKARGNLLNACAWVVGTAAFILILAAPAITWHVRTWAW